MKIFLLLQMICFISYNARQASSIDLNGRYRFTKRNLLPIDELDPRQPLVVVVCGAFNPVTYTHLRMFEMAKDYVEVTLSSPADGFSQNVGGYQLIGGYFSPAADGFKPGMVSAQHRVDMLDLTVKDDPTSWLMVDTWEARKKEATRTAVVLDHFAYQLNKNRKGKRQIKVMLLAGGDQIDSFRKPGEWLDDDLHHILGKYGCMVIERNNADSHKFVLEHDILFKYHHNVVIIK